MSKLLLFFLVATSLACCEGNQNGTASNSPEASPNLPPGSQFEFVDLTTGIFDSFDGKVRNMEQVCLNLDYTFRKYFW